MRRHVSLSCLGTRRQDFSSSFATHALPIRIFRGRSKMNECLDHLPRLGDEFEKIYGNKKIKVRVFRATARKSLEVNFVVEKVKSSEE